MALKNVVLCSSRPHLSTLASAPLAATDRRRKQPKAKERSETGEGYWTHAAKEHSVSGCCSPQWLHPLGIPRAEQRESDKTFLQLLPLSLTRSPAFISSCLDKRENKVGKMKGGCFQSRSQRESGAFQARN